MKKKNPVIFNLSVRPRYGQVYLKGRMEGKWPRPASLIRNSYFYIEK